MGQIIKKGIFFIPNNSKKGIFFQFLIKMDLFFYCL